MSTIFLNFTKNKNPYGTSHIKSLITVSKATHSTHDTQHIVVGSVDTNLGREGRRDRVVGERKDERGIVNAGEVACA